MSCAVRSSGRPSSQALEARPDAFEVNAMAYNILFQYGQIPLANGSYPAWVCESYPYVVDHPELRWEHRFDVITATIARQSPDLLALNEMRGGFEVPRRADLPEPQQDPAYGPPQIRDMTRWLRDEAPGPYQWLSVRDVDASMITYDPHKTERWPGGGCRRDMSANACTAYDPRTDHYSSKNYLVFRSDRFDLEEAGAVELPTSMLSERRFAPWARLRERSSGLAILAMAVHLDPFSGAHRIHSARRILEFIETMHPTSTVVLGDFNTQMNSADDCVCGCGSRAGCECPESLLASCTGQSTYRTLTASLIDTFLEGGGARDATSVMTFRVPSGQTWRSSEPCWPHALQGEGRAHLPEIAIERGRARVDYIFVTPGVAVLDAAIATPEVFELSIDAARRTIHPSDHFPVTATLRVGPSPRGTDRVSVRR